MKRKNLVHVKGLPPLLFYKMAVRGGWMTQRTPEQQMADSLAILKLKENSNVVASDLETTAPYSDIATNRSVGVAL